MKYIAQIVYFDIQAQMSTFDFEKLSTRQYPPFTTSATQAFLFLQPLFSTTFPYAHLRSDTTFRGLFFQFYFSNNLFVYLCVQAVNLFMF